MVLYATTVPVAKAMLPAVAVLPKAHYFAQLLDYGAAVVPVEHAVTVGHVISCSNKFALYNTVVR